MGNVAPSYSSESKTNRFFRRLLLWTIVCAVSAAPSFFWAQTGQYHSGAMIFGVALFALAYTICTSNDWFDWFYHRPFIRTTMRIGYYTRVMLSIAFPIGAVVDLYPGPASISIVNSVMGYSSAQTPGFARTLLITLVQGTLLNILIFIFMLFVYAIQRAFRRPPDEQLRAFEVIMPTTPLTPNDARPQ